MANPIHTVFTGIWTLLDGHAGLDSPVIIHSYKFDSIEEVPPEDPNVSQLPDLTVVFTGGPVHNIDTNLGPWFSVLGYSIIARTDSMKIQTAMDICWEILDAITASNTNHNLNMTGTVTHCEIVNVDVTMNDEASRWQVQVDLSVHLATNP
mgnify:CR=1 FL=1